MMKQRITRTDAHITIPPLLCVRSACGVSQSDSIEHYESLRERDGVYSGQIMVYLLHLFETIFNCTSNVLDVIVNPINYSALSQQVLISNYYIPTVSDLDAM